MDVSERRQQQVVGLLGAVATVAWTAVPDWTTTPGQRRLARAGIAAAGTAVGVAASVALRDRVDDADEGADEVVVEGSTFDLRTAAPVAAGLVTALVLARGAHGLERRVVVALERRGVRRPHTWVGVGSGLATLAVAPVERWLDGLSPDEP